MKKSKKLIAAILTVMLTLTLMPAITMATDIGIYTGTGVPIPNIDRSDVIFINFGGRQWVVVGNADIGVSTGNVNHITLLLDGTLGTSAFRTTTSNVYSGSSLQTKMNQAADELSDWEKR